MRFVSMYGRYRVQVRPQISEVFGSGDVRVTQESIYASFERNILQPHEKEAAIKQFRFRGQFQERDEATMVDPEYRISVFDTAKAALEEGWNDTIREYVEDRLKTSPAYGIDYIHVPALVIPPPWPTFDSYRGTPENLLKKLEEDGHSLEDVLAYEREHRNRPKYVEAIATEIERQLTQPPAADEVLA